MFRLVMANLHIVSACEWNSAFEEKRVLPYWNRCLLPTVCAVWGKWLDNCAMGGFGSAHACMSQVHSGWSTGAPRWGCPWREFLSVAGLSLIYRGHNWAAGRTGGAWAPSLSQPQVMANYIFISVRCGRTRTDLQPRPENDIYLAGQDRERHTMISGEMCSKCVCVCAMQLTAWQKSQIHKLLQTINYSIIHSFWSCLKWSLRVFQMCF